MLAAHAANVDQAGGINALGIFLDANGPRKNEGFKFSVIIAIEYHSPNELKDTFIKIAKPNGELVAKFPAPIVDNPLNKKLLTLIFDLTGAILDEDGDYSISVLKGEEVIGSLVIPFRGVD